jgi:hypothetical protein
VVDGVAAEPGGLHARALLAHREPCVDEQRHVAGADEGAVALAAAGEDLAVHGSQPSARGPVALGAGGQ